MEAVNNRVILVRVPEMDMGRQQELRDYILESLARGVLVLTEDASCEVMELPPLGGVKVIPAAGPEPPADEGPPGPELPPGEASEGEEKRAILRRLQDYRAAHGRGCLAEVAKATRTRGRISDSTLRMLLTGDTVLPIEDWRKIGRALERLERQEKEEASHAG